VAEKNEIIMIKQTLYKLANHLDKLLNLIIKKFQVLKQDEEVISLIVKDFE